MQFLNTLTLAFSLLAVGVVSSPVPGTVDNPTQEARSITIPEAPIVERDDLIGPYDIPVPVELTSSKRTVEEVTERDASADKLFARSTQTCAILGSSTVVNCRSGPGTNYPVTYTVSLGKYYAFTCYKTGTCVDGNCTWDREKTTGCYVSGYYTDASCTPARLGLC